MYFAAATTYDFGFLLVKELGDSFDSTGPAVYAFERLAVGTSSYQFYSTAAAGCFKIQVSSIRGHWVMKNVGV